MTTRKKKSKRWKGELYDPIESWYMRNLDIENRLLFFGFCETSSFLPGEAEEGHECMVDDLSAQNIIKSLHLLDGINHKPIRIIWSSYGGYWCAGMAIYDTIANLKSSVTIEAYGRIRSMGSIILQIADKRLLSKNCEFLTHYGSFSFEGTSKDAEREVIELASNNIVMEDIYLARVREKHPAYSRKKFCQKYLDHNTYFTPQQAVDLGLADGIL